MQRIIDPSSVNSPGSERRQSDGELARAAISGDVASMGQLFERYRPQLFASALAIVGYNADAEDAVHDTFLTALTRLEKLRDPAAVGGWLHAILRNRCLMEVRRRRPGIPSEETQRRIERQAADDGEDLLEKRIAARELRDWVWLALSRLPEEQRLTVLLRYFGSYNSYEEVAAILGVPVGTVRSRLADAKVKLAELLLACAGLEDSDSARLTEERSAFFRGALRELYRGGRDKFLANFSRDMRLLQHTGDWQVGRSHFAAIVDEDLAAGVKIHPRRFLVSGNMTVLEGAFENPADDPFHCPPGIAIVFFQNGTQTGRMHLHLSARPPSQEAAE